MIPLAAQYFRSTIPPCHPQPSCALLPAANLHRYFETRCSLEGGAPLPSTLHLPIQLHPTLKHSIPVTEDLQVLMERRHSKNLPLGEYSQTLPAFLVRCWNISPSLAFLLRANDIATDTRTRLTMCRMSLSCRYLVFMLISKRSSCTHPAS